MIFVGSLIALLVVYGLISLVSNTIWSTGKGIASRSAKRHKSSQLKRHSKELAALNEIRRDVYAHVKYAINYNAGPYEKTSPAYQAAKIALKEMGAADTLKQLTRIHELRQLVLIDDTRGNPLNVTTVADFDFFRELVALEPNAPSLVEIPGDAMQAAARTRIEQLQRASLEDKSLTPRIRESITRRNGLKAAIETVSARYSGARFFTENRLFLDPSIAEQTYEQPASARFTLRSMRNGPGDYGNGEHVSYFDFRNDQFFMPGGSVIGSDFSSLDNYIAGAFAKFHAEES